jgi:hypothetical protein
VTTIFTPHYSPRALAIIGGGLPLVSDPLAWTGVLVSELHKLREVTRGQHEEAGRAMVEAGHERHLHSSRRQQSVVGIMKADVEAAQEKIRAGLLALADDAVNVVDTKAFTWGLGEAIETVDEELYVAAQDEDVPRFEILVRGMGFKGTQRGSSSCVG